MPPHPGYLFQTAGPRETEGLSQDTDVFLAPKLVGEGGEALEGRYSGAEQALLLGWAMHVRKGSAQVST